MGTQRTHARVLAVGLVAAAAVAVWVPLAGVDYSVNSEPFDLAGPAYTHETELELAPAE